jgi:predicted HTH domain antitoxin
VTYLVDTNILLRFADRSHPLHPAKSNKSLSHNNLPMQITIEIPDEYIQQLQPNLENFSQRILETLVVEAYKNQKLTSAEVGRVLNLNRFEVETFLKEYSGYLHYTIKDFHQDLQTLQHLQQQ